MAIDIPRLVAACDRDLMRSLFQKIAPAEEALIDWALNARTLGLSVRDAASKDSKVWVQLQQIASLAQHARRPTIRSVLYHDAGLRDAFDELPGGMETAAVWLALQGDELFEYCLSAVHADQGLNKRSWKAFRVRLPRDAKISFSQERIVKFQQLVSNALKACPAFDAPGELETHHFRRVLFPEDTHGRRLIDQVTLFAEARKVTEDAFVESRLQTMVRRKVDSISVVHDRERHELDVVTIGGKTFIEQVGRSFFLAFSLCAPRLEPLIRREVKFDTLLRKPTLNMVDNSHFTHAKIDEIRVRSPSGGLYTFEAKGHRDSNVDVYEVARCDLGDRSPFEQNGWKVVSARVILYAAPSKPLRWSRLFGQTFRLGKWIVCRG
ncbi:MAG: hypothetical protein ACKVP3_04630 [Hyphomicrobiaceae bacterium]